MRSTDDDKSGTDTLIDVRVFSSREPHHRRHHGKNNDNNVVLTRV